jgi:hypothetical protein
MTATQTTARTAPAASAPTATTPVSTSERRCPADTRQPSDTRDPADTREPTDTRSLGDADNLDTTPDDADSSDDKSDTPQTPDELKRKFVSLDKREKKHRKLKRDLEKSKKDHAEAVAKAKQDLIDESRRISALQRHADQKFGWAVRGEQAWDSQDKVAFAKAIERMAKGASLASVTQWLAGATDQPKAPEKQQPSAEEQAWRAEKAEWERQRAAEREKSEETTDAARAQRAKDNLASSFAKHPFLQNPDDPKRPDPDALDEAFYAFKAAMGHRKPGETAREVAKRTLDGLHAKELRRLKRLGLEPKAPASKTPEKTAAAKTGERLPEPPATNRIAKPPSLDDTRANRIALARRMSEQQRRGVVA